MRRLPTLLLLVVLVAVATARAEDWPQFSGPNGNFTSTSSGLADQWPEGGPKVVWEARVNGGGFASPIIAGGKVFVLAREIEGDLKGWNDQKVKAGAPDVLYAFDLKTGNELWKHEIPLQGKCDGTTAWSTPVSDGELVYARGGDGAVHCVSAADGKLLWQWPKEGEAPEKEVKGKKWGRLTGTGNSIPLILSKELVLFAGYAAGGAKLFIAADRKTGEVKWESELGVGDGGWFPASTPVVKTIGGKEMLFIWGNALDVTTGKNDKSPLLIKWVAGNEGDSFVAAFERGVTVPTEKVEEEKKLYGPRFNVEGGLTVQTPELAADGKLGGKTVWEWKKRGGVNLAYGGQLLAKDAVFVFLDINNGNRVVCLKRDSGEELWQAQLKHGLGYANAILADNKLIYVWNGTLSMLAADPKGYRELASAPICEGSWASLTKSDGLAIVRGGAGTVKCLDLRISALPKPVQVAAAPADDWPAIEGPSGDYSSAATGLLERFPQAPPKPETPNAPPVFVPKVVWEARTEPGLVAPLIAGGKVLLLHQKEWGMRKDNKGELQKDKDGKPQYDIGGGWRSGVGPLVLSCLDLTDGKELWKYEFKPPVPQEANKPPRKYAGPYVAPVISGDKVFALGGAQELVCVNLADGKPVWTLAGDNLGAVTERADTVVVSANRVFCVGEFANCTRLNVVDKATGRFLWSKLLASPNWQNRNTTPRLLRLDKAEYLQITGFETLATMNEEGAAPAVFKDPEQFWNYDPSKCFLAGNRVFVNRQWVTEAFELNPAADGAFTCKKVWSREESPNQSMIALSGRVFFLSNDRRTIKAREPATGKPIWEGVVDRGQVVSGIGADNKLVLLNAPNEVILAKADAAQYEELTRAGVPGLLHCWSAPAFSKGLLVVRDCTGQVKCVDLRKQ